MCVLSVGGWVGWGGGGVVLYPDITQPLIRPCPYGVGVEPFRVGTGLPWQPHETASHPV